MSLRERFKLEEIESKRLSQRKAFPMKDEPTPEEVKILNSEEESSES